MRGTDRNGGRARQVSESLRLNEFEIFVFQPIACILTDTKTAVSDQWEPLVWAPESFGMILAVFDCFPAF